MQTHDLVDELLPGFALGILDADEASVVVAHLDQCGTCRRAVAEFQIIAGDLTLLIEERAPTPHLKARLLQKIEVEKKASWEAERPLLSGLVSRWRPAFAALLLILIAGNIILFMQLRQSRQSSVGDFQPIVLGGSEIAPEASGLIIMSDDGEHGTLIVQHLPPLDETQAYQLWLIDGDDREDGGVFGVSRDGYANIWVRSEQPLSHYQTFGVTIEPEDGSPSPTGVNVLVSQR